MTVLIPVDRGVIAKMLREDRHPFWAESVLLTPSLFLPTVLRLAARWCRIDMHYSDEAAFDLIDILYWEADVREEVSQGAYDKFAAVVIFTTLVGALILDAYWSVN